MDKPKWAQRLIAVRSMERRLAEAARQAVELRCSSEDSGGARCTADAQPEHAHRYRIEDLP